MLNKSIEILSYICIIAILVMVFSGVYELIQYRPAPYTMALAVAVGAGCVYMILKLIRDGENKNGKKS